MEKREIYLDNSATTRVFPEVVRLMGTIYLRARLNDKALMEFLKATTCTRHFDEGTNSFRAFHNIGCIYEAYGQYDEARKYYQKAGDFELSKERLANLPK